MNPNQAISTPATATNTPDTVEENYWPNIKKWMQTGEGPKPVVKCSICCENPLIIENLQEPDSGEKSDGKLSRTETEGWERMVRFRCQHVLGTDCTVEWIKHDLGRYSKNGPMISPRCAICREDLCSSQEKLEPIWRLVHGPRAPAAHDRR